MTSTPSRRTVLKAGAGTAAASTAAALVASPAAPAAAATPVFQHGVASGDPTATAIVLWTRVTPTPAAVPGSGAGPAVDVVWELAADAAFAHVLRRGTVRTTSAVDHTVKVDVRGLTPYTRYHYRFRALGATSPAGRTQTAGDERGATHALRFAIVSCSNWTGGYFTPYRYLARRDDLDFVMHLGDYLYEYGNGADRYGPDVLKGKRDHRPAHEIVSAQDYLVRHGQYKTDPDLQAAHARTPWIVVFDDHEVANDSWESGAENHQSATEGSYAVRRRAAYRAYVLWMPIRLPSQRGAVGTRFWRRFTFGALADLSITETRQHRSEQVEIPDAGELDDPTRRIMEPQQMAWLKAGVQDPSRRWHLLGNQVVFTRLGVTPGIPGASALLPALSAVGVSVGEPRFNTDQWDGYQDDQRELMTAMASAPAGTGTVVLTGDIHSSWANDLPVDPGTYLVTSTAGLGGSAGVEFVCPSVTSDGFGEVLGGDGPAKAATTAFMTANPWIKYLEGTKHGYTVIDVTPARVQADFWFVSQREDPRATQSFAAAWQTRAGSRQVTPASAQVGARSDSPRAAAIARPAGRALPVRPVSTSPAATPTTAGGALAATGLSPVTAVAGAGALAAGLAGLRARGRS